jgi:ABC-type nitrate/sulfonate/bicarbonate transport system substrate-binding protein
MRSPFLVFIALAAALLTSRSSAAAEPLRIAYTAISLMYGPLWITREAGLFKKYGLDAELLYLSGGTMSTAALISDDVQISFTGASNVVAANLAGSDAVLLGATIDLLLGDSVHQRSCSTQRHKNGCDAVRFDDPFCRPLRA